VSTVRITQRKSRNGADRRQLETLRSLGLRRIGHTVEHSDSPQLRGMIYKVQHLVEVESPGGDSSASSAGAELAGARS
jgi:large subunit ribosomal protein L30